MNETRWCTHPGSYNLSYMEVVGVSETTVEHALEQARHLRLVEDLASRDVLRAVRSAADLGALQREIAAALRVSQPAVVKMLQRQPADAPSIPAGHSGATPYEVAERYAAGQVSREQMRAELGAWHYAPRQAPDIDEAGVPDLTTVDALDEALRRGLIDEDDYDAIADLLEVNAP